MRDRDERGIGDVVDKRRKVNRQTGGLWVKQKLDDVYGQAV
jgi:hypothetical protein